MSVDKSGEWWVGTEPTDIKDFLEAYAPEGFEVHRFELAKCKCGSDRFHLDADDDEGFAKRTCVVCADQHFICDSQVYEDAVKPERCKCLACGCEETNVGVGFSLYEEDGEIRWLYVGVRCARCGVVGCFAGWKIAYAPSKHLMTQV